MSKVKPFNNVVATLKSEKLSDDSYVFNIELWSAGILFGINSKCTSYNQALKITDELNKVLVNFEE